MKKLVLFFYVLFFFSSFSMANNPQKLEADTTRIVHDLYTITKSISYRHLNNIPALDSVAEYIKTEYKKNCDSVYFQEFEVVGKTYKNVIGSIGLDKKERLIIGAHYDVFGEQEGADDNASGVTGLLELSRILKNDTLPFRIDFVAFTLEEAPFFLTDNMGSYKHAKYLVDNKIPTKGIICMDEIGCFSDKSDSQDFPFPLLTMIYGDVGNFILLVVRGNDPFENQIEENMKKASLIPTRIFVNIDKPGLEFSDHHNYWEFNIPGLLITDTSLFRNNNYHKNTDKMETLDIGKMKAVIDEIAYAIRRLK